MNLLKNRKRSIARRGGVPKIHTVLILCLLVFCAPGSWAAANPRATASARIGSARVEIQYGRPSLHGRDVLKLIAPGQLWRLGADAPTTLESNTDLDVGGMRVPRGKHILLVRYIEPGVWSLVVSKEPAIQYVPSARLAEVLLRFERVRDPAEELSIHLSEQHGKGEIVITWGSYRLSGEFAPVK